MKLFHPCYILILLSLTTTSLAVVQYAKEGCNEMCGNVKIPYPFGIGANCSVNEWYMVDCNSSIPYLPALHQLEVLGVDLINRTITVNTPVISVCSNSSQTMSINLDSSPFLFSNSQNNFVFVGCGHAVIIDNGSVLTGCSTDCHNDTISEKNNCFGITCCQTKNPRYLKSYTMNITRLEKQVRDGGCGSAFLVDKNLYGDGRAFDINSFVPVSLMWTLTDLDYFDQVSCCDGHGYKSYLDLDNIGTAVYTWYCNFPDSYNYDENPGSIEGNPYLENGCLSDRPAKSNNYAKAGCNSMCGSVRIPYPFGIGAKCAINDWYVVDCNSSTPYLSALHHLEILGVDLKNQTVTVNTPIISDCSSISYTTSTNLDSSPFLFSKSHNNIVFMGCGNVVVMDNGSSVAGCSTNCLGEKNNCLGITCCQTTISHYLRSYTMQITRLERQGTDGACGSAFLVDKKSFENGKFSQSNSFIPT